jgi:hypothetical protein
MTCYVIKIDNREYKAKESPNGHLEIGTEIGWLSGQSFIEYLYKNEKINALLDLAQIGLDRLLGKRY